MPKYRKKPIIVEAVKLTRSITIETPTGPMKGLPGDYLVTDKTGEQHICDRDQFEAEFELIHGKIRLKKMFQNSFQFIKTKIYIKHS